MEKKRCEWAKSHPLLSRYHDLEWGVEVHDDIPLFESLILDGAQAGLSWLTVLKKRDAYRMAFDGFDPEKIARYGFQKIKELMANPGIIRNRRKIESAIVNAKCFLEIQKEFSAFSKYLWAFVGGRPIINRWRSLKELPAVSDESIRMSSDLKKRGFSFVGPTICYAFMQAVGMVNDHVVDCFRHSELSGKQKT